MPAPAGHETPRAPARGPAGGGGGCRGRGGGGGGGGGGRPPAGQQIAHDLGLALEHHPGQRGLAAVVGPVGVGAGRRAPNPPRKVAVVGGPQQHGVPRRGWV
ncbi:hypothetical protein, partial [Nocardia cyriacigeorgica]|uniref:hypothetical protein n=1 Tax=Nocardia cyriacigeorgica TaxID=135487 RepID=UPI003CC7C5C6